MITVFEDNIDEDAEEFFLTFTEHSCIVKRLDLRITTSFVSIFINGKFIHVSPNILSTMIGASQEGTSWFSLQIDHSLRYPSLYSYMYMYKYLLIQYTVYLQCTNLSEQTLGYSLGLVLEDKLSCVYSTHCDYFRYFSSD